MTRFRVRFTRHGDEYVHGFDTLAEAEWCAYVIDKHWSDWHPEIEVRVGDCTWRKVDTGRGAICRP